MTFGHIAFAKGIVRMDVDDVKIFFYKFGRTSTYNRASDVCMCVSHVLDRQLLERLMSPSPKSQVMFASAFS